MIRMHIEGDNEGGLFSVTFRNCLYVFLDKQAQPIGTVYNWRANVLYIE